MADTPNINLSTAQLAARAAMRQSLLDDFDAQIESAGGLDDYVYTATQQELDRMLHRVHIVSTDAGSLPGEGASADSATQRIRDVGYVLENEVGYRRMVALEAVSNRGELAYDLPGDGHLLSQSNLSRRLSYHERKLADVNYEHREGFDHIAAAASYRDHLLAQQTDAYDRGLPIETSKETQFLLGAKLHDRATRAVLRTQESAEPGWNVDGIAEVIAGHAEYLKDAIDLHRQFRHDIAIDQGQGVYPPNLPEDREAAYDVAADRVDDAVNVAYGRDPERERAVPSAILDFPSEVPRFTVGADGNVDVDRELSALTAPGPGTATPARYAYLNARIEAGAVGAALADPKIQQALKVAHLEVLSDQHAAIDLQAYHAPRPSIFRPRARAQWGRDFGDAITRFQADFDAIEKAREPLGPDADRLVARATELTKARDEILASTLSLQRDAIAEEISREPEWLTNTLGPRPEADVAPWQALAGELAANRLRFAVTDDAGPGIRPDQTMLADKVSRFRSEIDLSLALSTKPDLGFGF